MSDELGDALQYSDKAKKALEVVRGSHARTSFLTSIPLVCKAERCPYADICPLVVKDLAPLGERCPIEVAAIEDRFFWYLQTLNVDSENAVDVTLVKELCSLDVQLVRCENRLAIDADFIQEVVVAIGPRGQQITQPTLHQAAQYKETLLKRRHSILSLLSSTRKDKAGIRITHAVVPSDMVKQIIERKQALEAERVMKEMAITPPVAPKALLDDQYLDQIDRELRKMN